METLASGPRGSLGEEKNLKKLDAAMCGCMRVGEGEGLLGPGRGACLIFGPIDLWHLVWWF